MVLLLNKFNLVYSLLTTCEYSVLEPREVSQYIINASSRAQAPSSPAKSLSLVLKNSLLPGPGPRSRSQTVGGPVSETPTLRLAAEHTGAWARDWGVSNEWTIITERLRERGANFKEMRILSFEVSIKADCSGCQGLGDESLFK